jgi:phage tail sheath protein FI
MINEKTKSGSRQQPQKTSSTPSACSCARSGVSARFGRTEEEPFFVTCDRTTMTQDDILNGRLVCEIGIPPVRPAEFVIFRIFQNTAEAQS